jgi:hypothetical protein
VLESFTDQQGTEVEWVPYGEWDLMEPCLSRQWIWHESDPSASHKQDMSPRCRWSTPAPRWHRQRPRHPSIRRQISNWRAHAPRVTVARVARETA